MKKWLAFVLIGVLGLSAGVGVSNLFSNEEEGAYTQSLNKRLENRSGDSLLKLTKNIELVTSGSVTTLGSYSSSELTIDGSGMNVTVVGAAKSVIKANNFFGTGALVFKNLMLIDQSEDGAKSWETYMWFGGKLRFEDCTIVDPIYLTSNANAEFINCRFISPETQRYSVWVADGSARFENCMFTGYRGIKIHEFEGGDDVTSVAVENCLFNRLFEKPGLAIGSIINNPMETKITVSNSRFEYCAAWDTVGSLVGVDSFYEADTLLEEFAFSENKNIVLF